MLEMILNGIDKIGWGTLFIAITIILIWRNTWHSLRLPDSPGNGTLDRTWRLNLLKKKYFSEFYMQYVKKILNFIDFIIGDNSNPKKKLKSFNFFGGNNPWNEKCFSFSLSMAFIYPVFGFLIAWVLGANGSMASFPLLPSEQSTLFRILLLLTIVLSVWTGLKFSSVKEKKEKIIYLFIWLFFSLTTIYISYSFNFPIIVIMGIAVTSVLATVSVHFFATLSVAFISILIAIVLMFMNNISDAITVLSGGLVFFLIQSFWHWFRAKKRNILWVLVWHIGWILLIILSIATLAKTSDFLTIEAIGNIRIFLTMFVLFPLINAPLDWVSLGLTRGLLQKIIIGNNKLNGIFWAIMDVIFAGIFWLLMVTIIVVFLTILNSIWGHVSEVPFDVTLFLHELGDNPWAVNHLWIHLMALTTLLPTIIHFMVALFSFVNVISSVMTEPFIKKFLSDWPEKEEVYGDRLLVATILFVSNILAFMIPFILIIIFYPSIELVIQESIESYITYVTEILIYLVE